MAVVDNDEYEFVYDSKYSDSETNSHNGVVDDAVIEDEEEISNPSTHRFVEKFFNFFHSSRHVTRLAAFVLALLLTGEIYLLSTTYNPKKREFLTNNIYSGNSLVLSEDELKSVEFDLEERFNISIEDDDEEVYLLHALINNPWLTEDEVNSFSKVIDLVRENSYLNLEEVYSTLLNVDISYKRRPITMDKEVEGVYLDKYNSIGIFVDDDEKRVLYHELIHCIFSNSATDKLPKYFDEGMTELLSNEYFSDKPYVEYVNYPFEISAVKILCEVSSPEAVLKAYTYGDMGYIAEEISKVTGDREGADKALYWFSYIMRQYRDELVDGEKKLDRNTMVNGCIPLFREVIDAKYKPEEHSRVSYYYNEILLANIFEADPFDAYVDDLVEFGSDHKAYFSKKLISEMKKDGELHKTATKVVDIT